MPHELPVGGTKITELRYADDTALFSTTPEGLNNLVQAVNKHSAAYKLSINAAKTEILGPLLFIIYINDLYGKWQIQFHFIRWRHNSNRQYIKL